MGTGDTDQTGQTTKPDLASIKRVQDQLDAFTAVKQHVQSRDLKEIEFYPEHKGRVGTPEYKKVHDHMIHELHLPCLVCGVTDTTIHDDAKNPDHAKQLETHHCHIEWAMAEAIDVDKFNTRMLPHLAFQHPNDPDWKYEEPFDKERLLDWIDHSQHNLWVLCDKHHRAPYMGIHEITYPIWAPMDLLREDFEEWARGELEKLGKKIEPPGSRPAAGAAAGTPGEQPGE